MKAMLRVACSRSWSASRGRLTSTRVRHFSDKLMGYSPMSPGGVAPINPDSTKIPTAKDVTTSGGVWAPTSSKRDKLTELKLELDPEQLDLDAKATPLQMQDLYLSDGIHLVAKVTDQGMDAGDSSAAEDEQAESLTTKLLPQIEGFLTWLEQTKTANDSLDRESYAAVLAIISEKIVELRDRISTEESLKEIRDFMDPSQMDDVTTPPTSDQDIKSLGAQNGAFQTAVLLFRFHLVHAVLEHLREEDSWKKQTDVSDSDVDRAAVKGANIEELRKSRQVVSAAELRNVVRSFATGSNDDRVDALWELFDQDGDGLLDQPEMNEVVYCALTPIQKALNTYFEAVLEANVHSVMDDRQVVEDPLPMPTGFLARRREKGAKKRLMKLFNKTTKNHFLDEVELPHRLRCIYAWSEKKHQNNKLDSVLVEAGDADWAGRKRYVELPPKIAIEEFREVQKIHFPHLDRSGAEIMKSFRENLWVQQGKGRQNSELQRDCLLFLVGVSIIDYGILAM